MWRRRRHLEWGKLLIFFLALGVLLGGLLRVLTPFVLVFLEELLKLSHRDGGWGHTVDEFEHENVTFDLVFLVRGRELEARGGKVTRLIAEDVDWVEEGSESNER